MLVRVLDSANKYIEHIIIWFYDTYGIHITGSEAVQFAINTTDVEESLRVNPLKYRVSTKLPTSRYRIDTKASNKLRQILAASFGDVDTRDEVILSSIIVHRSITLPIKKSGGRPD